MGGNPIGVHLTGVYFMSVRLPACLAWACISLTHLTAVYIVVVYLMACTSWRVPHGVYLMGMYLICMHLISVYFMGVHLVGMHLIGMNIVSMCRNCRILITTGVESSIRRSR
jgi:hypothetical protein